MFKCSIYFFQLFKSQGLENSHISLSGQSVTGQCPYLGNIHNSELLLHWYLSPFLCCLDQQCTGMTQHSLSLFSHSALFNKMPSGKFMHSFLYTCTHKLHTSLGCANCDHVTRIPSPLTVYHLSTSLREVPYFTTAVIGAQNRWWSRRRHLQSP